MAERKTVWRFIFVWNYEKEERWLNEMAMNGWALVSVFWFRYTFETCEPGEYIVRLEMNNDPSYETFIEETGAEVVGRFLQWRYFRRKAEMGPFDLFSDIDSKVAHLKKIGTLLFSLGMVNLVVGMINSFLPHNHHVAWMNLLCCTVLMYGLGRIHGKKEELEKDRLLHE